MVILSLMCCKIIAFIVTSVIHSTISCQTDRPFTQMSRKWRSCSGSRRQRPGHAKEKSTLVQPTNWSKASASSDLHLSSRSYHLDRLLQILIGPCLYPRRKTPGLRGLRNYLDVFAPITSPVEKNEGRTFMSSTLSSILINYSLIPSFLYHAQHFGLLCDDS